MTPERDSRPKAARGTTAAGKPPVIDMLLQSATVAVFHACGVASAPLAPLELAADELELEFPVVTMAFRAPGIDAALVTSLPKSVCARLDIGRRSQADTRDILREFTNLVMGRLKNRLTLYQVTLKSSLPICRDRQAELDSVFPKSGTVRAFRFRTLDGVATLALKGTIDESRLVYSSTIQINAEGDIILF
jgi:hypothetical protein